MIASIHFDKPAYLWILVLVPVFYYLLKWKIKNYTLSKPWLDSSQKHSFIFPFIKLTEKSLNNVSNRKTLSSTGLLVFAITACLIFSLAKPYTLGSIRPIAKSERHFVILIDNSISMMLKDYQVSGVKLDRMSFLKTVASKIIKKFKGDKISIVAYSDQAHVLVPFSSDTQLLLKQLARVDTELTGRSNHLSYGLSLSAKLIFQYAKTHNLKTQPRVILLGHGARIIEQQKVFNLVELYRSKNIFLDVIGIGSTNLTNAENRGVRDVSKVLFDPVNTRLLRSIANHTGGGFILANKISSVDEMIRRLASSSRMKLNAKIRQESISWYRMPLGLGLLLLLLWQAKTIFLARK